MYYPRLYEPEKPDNKFRLLELTGVSTMEVQSMKQRYVYVLQHSDFYYRFVLLLRGYPIYCSISSKNLAHCYILFLLNFWGHGCTHIGCPSAVYMHDDLC